MKDQFFLNLMYLHQVMKSNKIIDLTNDFLFLGYIHSPRKSSLNRRRVEPISTRVKYPKENQRILF